MPDQRVISRHEFDELVRPLVGLPISRAWKGYGTAIFLELGALHEEPRLRGGTSLRGEAGVMWQWDWRVEKAQSNLAGSNDSTRIILNTLAGLEGLVILDIWVEGRIPELVISLSNRLWVHSFTIQRGHPEWALFLKTPIGQERNTWIKSFRAKLWQEWEAQI